MAKKNKLTKNPIDFSATAGMDSRRLLTHHTMASKTVWTLTNAVPQIFAMKMQIVTTNWEDIVADVAVDSLEMATYANQFKQMLNLTNLPLNQIRH